MYQRTYKEGYHVPENYSGTAVEECLPYENIEEVHSAPPPEEGSSCACEGEEHSPIGGKLRSLFERLPFHLPRFEGEDLLILGVAALLFFSKEGDKECALFLLILLFIG